MLFNIKGLAVLLAGIASVAVLLSACGSDPTPTALPDEVTPTPSAPPGVEVTDWLFQRGQELEQEQLYTQAVKAYDELIRINNRYPRAFVVRGEALRKLSEFEEALRDFTQAIRLFPDDWEAYYLRGSTFGNQGKLDLAVKDLDQAILRNPNHAPSHNALGFALSSVGKLEESIKAFDESLRLDPNYAVAYANRGMTYAMMGEDAKADADIEKAIELGLDPDSLHEELEGVKSQRT